MLIKVGTIKERGVLGISVVVTRRRLEESKYHLCVVLLFS